MDFGKLFKSVEDAVYEVMVWILLLPKTLLRAFFQPREAMNYVNSEFDDKKPEERFDDYLSPVLLWLLVTVFPISLAVIMFGENIPTSFTEGSKKLSDSLLPTTLYAMIIPFTYIAWMEMVNKKPLSRKSLRVSFYKHCFALTPGLLATALFFYISMETLVDALLIVSFIAIPIYEAFVFQSELGISYIRAFFLNLVPQIVLISSLIALVVVFDL